MLQRDKFYKTVYFGGIEQSLRRDIWPFLLHHYELESTVDERREIDRQMRRIYEEAMTEWCAAHLMLSALLCSALLLVLSFHFHSPPVASPSFAFFAAFTYVSSLFSTSSGWLIL